MWRLWNRANIQKYNPLITSKFFKNMFHFEVEYLDDDKVSLLNGSEKMRPVLGQHHPFGYCPYNITDGYVVLTTFLLPGFKNTPENAAIGHRVEATNIFEVEDVLLQEQSMRTVANEANESLGKFLTKYKSKYEHLTITNVNKIWEKCKSWYKIPATPAGME
jgi:hypothetical protein